MIPVFRIVCPLNATGVGTHAQYLVQEFMNLDAESKIQFTVLPVGKISHSIHPLLERHLGVRLMLQRERQYDTTVILDTPQKCVVHGSRLRPQSERLIAYTVFETSVPNEVLEPLIAIFDEIWVPSEWCAGYIVSGFPKTKVKVVYEGVNPALAEASRYEKGDTVLTVGKFERRKGQDLLLESALATKEKMTVHGHWYNPWVPKVSLEYLADHGWIPGGHNTWKQGRVTVVDDHSHVQWHAGLWNALPKAQVAVFPHRGEAWGLPVLEAIACGIPVIAPFHSGSCSYLDRYVLLMDEAGLKVNILEEFKEEVAIDPPFFTGKQGGWYVPYPTELNQALSNALHDKIDPAKYLEIGKKMADEYSWARSAQMFIEALADD